MRKIVHKQLALVPRRIDHVHGDELVMMSRLLDKLPRATRAIHRDLVHRVEHPDKGREGMTAEQVLRAVVIKQMNGFSYEELAFHLVDSMTYRSFCRFGIGDTVPTKATLQRNVKLIEPETLELVNRLLVEQAVEKKIETGRKVRVDCTVSETNIHEPSDSSLLWDSVRVLTRLMERARELVAGISFADHRRRAKRRFIAITHTARFMEKRVPLYRDLLKITERTVEVAVVVAERLQRASARTLLEAARLRASLLHYIELCRRVLDQTRRRVLGGQSVPATEKVVSIFEPHTDIIVKDRRDTHYGHKLCMTTGVSGLVLDYEVQEGNPADSKLAVGMIERHKTHFGVAPRQACFDGGFASRENLLAIKGLGVEDVAFSKKRGLEISEMVKSTWVYRRLKRFRAGIESTFSFLKRCFGLDRCLWRGFASFKAYVGASVVAANLLVLARHLLS